MNFAVMLSVLATLALGAHDKKGHTKDNREKERHQVVVRLDDVDGVLCVGGVVCGALTLDHQLYISI